MESQRPLPYGSRASALRALDTLPIERTELLCLRALVAAHLWPGDQETCSAELAIPLRSLCESAGVSRSAGSPAIRALVSRQIVKRTGSGAIQTYSVNWSAVFADSQVFDATPNNPSSDSNTGPAILDRSSNPGPVQEQIWTSPDTLDRSSSSPETLERIATALESLLEIEKAKLDLQREHLALLRAQSAVSGPVQKSWTGPEVLDRSSPLKLNDLNELNNLTIQSSHSIQSDQSTQLDRSNDPGPVQQSETTWPREDITREKLKSNAWLVAQHAIAAQSIGWNHGLAEWFAQAEFALNIPDTPGAKLTCGSAFRNAVRNHKQALRAVDETTRTKAKGRMQKIIQAKQQEEIWRRDMQNAPSSKLPQQKPFVQAAVQAVLKQSELALT